MVKNYESINDMLDSAAKLAPSMAADTASEFDVFVSYSRKDKDFCALLERSLRAYSAGMRSAS